MQAKSTRKIRMRGKYEPRARQWSGYKQVPFLRLSGVWLEQAGFKPGDQVEVMIANKSLVIKNLGCHGDQRD